MHTPGLNKTRGLVLRAERRHAAACVWVFLVAACSSSPKSSSPIIIPEPAREAVVYTTEYVTLSGTDTVGLEIVTNCFGRVIGDVSPTRPPVHVHYEMEFGADKIPRMLMFAIWSSRDSVGSKPSQVARTKFLGDSVLTEVWRGNDHQVQRAVAPHGSFLWVNGYAGLLAQLVAALKENGPATSMPLFFVATRGHTANASIKRAVEDSITIAIDSTQIATRWNASLGLQGAQFSGGPLRVERVAVPAQRLPNERCGQPPFLRDSVGRE